MSVPALEGSCRPSRSPEDFRPADPRSADLPDDGHSLGAYLHRWAGIRGDRRAVTFVDHRTDPAGQPQSLRWWQLDRRVAEVAQQVAGYSRPGDRVVVSAPAGPEYVVAFLACLYAGRIAVPLPPPGAPGRDLRLVSAFADCAPACVLTTTGTAEAVRRLVSGPVLTVDTLTGSTPGTDLPPMPVRPDDVAYLQYTSGSTRTPAGVAVTHGNVVANARQALAAICPDGEPQPVGWLPLFHDMGLVLSVAAPIVSGSATVLMDPEAFLRQPVRWLRLLSEVPGAVSAAPNFAFDLCVRRTTPADRAGLDLHRVQAVLNGSEPVQPATVRRFLDAFAPHGFAASMLRPAYGLAEATVFVAAGRPGAPVVTRFDRAALAAGTAVEADPGAPDAVDLVGCGQPAGQQLAIVDAGRAVECADGQVGEVWVRGPNVAPGYWRCADPRQGAFGAVLAPLDGRPPTDGWLRTGDLGVRHAGELYVTGRRKEILVVDGRNHYPHDIEATAQDAAPAVRAGRVAAVGGPDGTDGVVVVAEATLDADAARAAERAIRTAVASLHGIPVHDVLLVRPGAIPRTTSGKLARGACREAYLDGVWAPAGARS